jgi:transcriptional regulator with XRE-family HTH domain
MENFPEYLKGLRLETKLSYREVASRAGISAAYLLQIEHGQRGAPGAEILKKLAAVYSIPVKDMLKAAGYLDDPNEGKPALSDSEEVELAFTYVMNDPRYKSGTRLKGELTHEVKRFIVEMYEKATGKKLLPGG